MRDGVRFDAALEPALDVLPDDDRRLAHEIAAGVLRQRTALDAAITPHLRSPWDRMQPDLRDLLRIGAYQLVHLRVPDYAVVQSTVELAKRTLGPGPAGLVNAVLRKVARAASAPHTERTAPPGSGTAVPPYRPTAGDLAFRYSHPDWLVARWLERFGPERTETLLAHNNRPPPTVLQPLGWGHDRLLEALLAAGVDHDGLPDGGIVVRGRRVETLPGYEDGAFIVQDPAQPRVLTFARVEPGERIWDACAAPGGKAAALAASARVVASDTGGERLALLRDTRDRAAPDVPLLRSDARRPPFADVFDVVLVDAPCSATGTIARHPDARWRIQPGQIARLARLQGAILDGVAGTVRPGGRLVYITCSLEREENEDQVDQFLTRHPAFTRDGRDLSIFPADGPGDGAWAARLRRLP